MHKISGDSAKDGHFVDGSLSQEGTILSADWLNTVQDEICNVIISAGLPLNTMENEDKKQLINAIGRIVQNATMNLASKNDLNEYLNHYLKVKDIDNTSLGKWTITCIEGMLGIKYPNLPNKP